MLTKQQAIDKLESLLPELGRHASSPLVIVHERTKDLPYGWMFIYTSKRWLETRDMRHAIAGNGPVVILAATGEVIHLGTALPSADALAELERTRGLR